MLRSFFCLPLILFPLVVACGNDTIGSPTTDLGDVADLGCFGRQCLVYSTCGAGVATSVSGVVNTPAGTLPLPGVRVYIPSGDVLASPGSGVVGPGDSCGAPLPGDIVAQALTDTSGKFTITNVPSGPNIPLVISIGKWRRVYTIPYVTECANNPISSANTRLPRNQHEGNLPKIALSTGSEDALECLLRSNKLGLDDPEFTPPNGPGRVNLFAGGQTLDGSAGASQFAPSLNGGALFPSSNPWWNDSNNWNRYDLVLLACEGNQNAAYKAPAAHAALQNYLRAGGHVFASHWQNIWLAGGLPPLSTVATFVMDGGGFSSNGRTIQGTMNQPSQQPLANWLQQPSVGGSTQLGQLVISQPRATVASLNTSLAMDWIDFSDPGLPVLGLANPAPLAFSFSLPGPLPGLSAPGGGSMLFTDLHASGGGDSSSPGTPFPLGCTTTGLSPQEKALILLLFSLVTCTLG